MSALIGNKVLLRPIEKRDLENLNKWKNDESIYKNLGGGFMPVSIDIQEKWMDDMMDTTGNNKRFIIDTIQKETIGMVGLYNINWVHRTCELGVFIGDGNQQGKGYASEAYTLIEKFALQYLNLRKIKASVVEDNVSATKMYDKLGFVRAGRLIDERYINGTYHAVLIMEKLLM